MDHPSTPSAAPGNTLGFAAAVRAHGDAWRVFGACAHWHEGREREGSAMFFASSALSRDDYDYYLMRAFMPSGDYADRPRAWNGSLGE